MQAQPNGRQQVAGCNKLQAHKSSFQAWKCVSFGCSLLALVLLLSKWHEVTTDLQLLLGIDRILAINQDHLLQTSNSSTSVPLSWPPVPLEQLLPSINESSGTFGMESMSNNGTMLMSHMQINLNREMNGEQILRQEVDTFIGEFRNARSTLGLSCLLVIVYLISWILMTLAINDARISNDISLRNILLLSTFGAIDIAASVGFVMVRIIMYNVKNKPFASDLLGSAGLKDTPVKLTADQLTAFTALRLVSMRSSSAYMDIYVSVLVALLTILRLYAILRALTYYRHLRRINDSSLSLPSTPTIFDSLFPEPPPPPPPPAHQLALHGSIRSEKPLWTSNSSFYTPTARLRPGSANRRRTPERGRISKQQFVSDQPMYNQQQSTQYHLTGPLSLDTGATTLMFPVQGIQNIQQQQQQQQRGMSTTLRKTTRLNGGLQANQQAPIVTTLNRPSTSSKNMYIVESLSNRPKSSRVVEQKQKGSPEMMLINSMEQHTFDSSDSEHRETRLKQKIVSEKEAEESSQTEGAQVDNLQNLFTLKHESSEQNLLTLQANNLNMKSTNSTNLKSPRNTKKKKRDYFYNTIKSNGTTYALLTGDQLKKIGHKMQTTNTGSLHSGKATANPSVAKYKLMSTSRYLPELNLTLDQKQMVESPGKQRNTDSGLAGGDELEQDLASLSNLASLTPASSIIRNDDSDAEVRAAQRRKNQVRRLRQQKQVVEGEDGQEMENLMLVKMLKLQEEKAQMESANHLSQYYYA